MPRKGKENTLDGDEEDVEEMELNGEQGEGEEGNPVEGQMEEDQVEVDETGHEALRQRLQQVTDLSRYDPDQDKNERRELRVQYRELINRAEGEPLDIAFFMLLRLSHREFICFYDQRLWPP